MKTIFYPEISSISEILKRPNFDNRILHEKVTSIMDEVKSQGDKSLLDYTLKFDGVDIENLLVGKKDFELAENNITAALKEAIDTAKTNIEKFHSSQDRINEKVNIDNGITCWQKDVPIEKIGLYIPGGTSPLFSTLLMLGIPATIAKCSEITVCSPPQKNGKISDTILYVSKLLEIDKVYKVGGAQAIAAMALGTETIPKVDKIFGPGNQWVTMAKQIANSFGVAIDMPAGPSEVLVIADDSANPKFVATDLLSQAEHGVDSQVVLISTSQKMISTVMQEIDEYKTNLSRKDIIEKSLENSSAILVNNIQEAVAISNEYAPEHLILSVTDPELIADKIVSAGSVFLGNYSPESAGDYASGTNHTLPTNGYASAYSGVSLDSFRKKITFQYLTKAGLSNIASAVETMADAEGLDAHQLAVNVRREE